MLVAQLTDTHIVPHGETYAGHDSAAYLRDAIAALESLPERPTCVVVTGDLANRGRPSEYARFREIMSELSVPYFVIPGNHDDRDALRAALPPASFGSSRDATIRFVVDDFDVRLVGLDGNRPPSPGARLDDDVLRWLEAVLASQRPTIIAVHQPPFRTGLHYLDLFGFGGSRRLRRIVTRHSHVGRVLCGHIHCVRERREGAAVFASAPSTAPTRIPLLFMDGRLVGVRDEPPGFALHAWTPQSGFVTTVHRRDDCGAYRASAA
ncbi:MAG: phosphodiesterase [Vulcanimicrobiaceae bacterium]